MSKPVQAVDPDILDPKVSASCLDFLLIELVPLAYRITAELNAKEQALTEQFRKSQIFGKPRKAGDRTSGTGAQTRNDGADAVGAAAEGSNRDSAAGTVGASTSADMAAPDDETREAVFWRLDSLGYRVGQGLAERFSVGKPRPATPLDAIKFICKDLWTLVFRKQIDNLKTNHRGIFVLTDQRFQPLGRMSIDRRAGSRAADDALNRAQAFLYFPCGVIRGALAGLGIEVTVHAETTALPGATFQIKTKGAKA